MTTQEIANRLVELLQKGDFKLCYEELYSPEIISQEADGTQVKGIDGIAEKGKEWNASIEEFMGSTVGNAVVSGNYFSLPMSMTLKYKGSDQTMKFEEICMYHVQGGKIVKEQFFYDEPTPV